MEVAVDLDGTLARYDGWEGVDKIGDLVPDMVIIIKYHLERGDNVTIFTSRLSEEGDEQNDARYHIRKWMRKYGMPYMDITCVKHKKFQIFYDDRAITVERNTGKIFTEMSHALFLSNWHQ